ncbi:MAG TPA: PAS domain S-box protein, partial [Blastocatellia bacterium]|nr:PAS domain S-box protein [Blastocatellia bacterium]
YRDLVEHSRDLIYTHGMDGRFLTVNEAAAAILGYEPNELIGTLIPDILLPEVRADFDLYLNKVRDGSSASGLMLVRTRHGETKVLSYDNTVRTEGVPEPVVRGIAHDITELKKVENDLKSSEQQFRAVFDSSLDAMLIMNDGGSITEVNAAALSLFSMSRDALLGYSLRELAESSTNCVAVWAAFRRRSSEQGEFPLRRPGGETKIAEYSLTFSFLPGRNLLLLRDITRRRELEQDIRRSHEFLSNLLDYTPAVIAVVDLEGSYLMVNRGWEEATSTSREDAIGRLRRELWPPEAERTLGGSHKRVLETGGAVTNEAFIDLTHGRRYYHTVMFPLRNAVGQIDSIGSIAIDISERRRAEEALAESEERFRRTFEYAAVGMAVTAVDGSFLRVNPAFCKITGYTEDELKSLEFRSIIYSADLRRTLLSVDKLLSGSVPAFLIEQRYVKKNRSVRWVQTSISSILDSDGKASALIALSQDITDRKVAEVALKESEKRYETLTEVSPVGVFYASPWGKYLYVNERWCEITGFNARDALGEGWLEALHPEDRDRVTRHWAKTARDGRAFKSEYRLVRADGTTSWVIGQAVPEKSESGEIGGVKGFIGTITDITEQKRALEALRESEHRYQTLAQALPVGVFYFNVKGQCVYVNERWCEMTGLTPAQSYGSGWQKALSPEDRDLADWAGAVREHNRVKSEGRLVRPDGAVLWVFGQGVADYSSSGEVIGYIGSVTDITEVKRAEEALRKSEEKFRLLIENAHDIICITDEKSFVRYASPSLERVLGYRPEEVTGERAVKMVHPDDLLSSMRTFGHIGGRPDFVSQFEVRARHKNGSWRYMEVVVKSLLHDPDVAGIVFNARDITERNQAEEVLHRLAAIVESSDDGIISCTLDGCITSWNAGAEKVYGYSAAEIVGRNISIIAPPEREDFDQLLGKVRNGQGVSRHEAVGVTSGGQRIVVSVTISPVKDTAGKVTGASAIVRDITESMKLQEQLRQSQKMEAIGRLAGGVAHDFNNLLTAINGYSDLTLMRLSQGDPLRENVMEVRKAGDRAASLTRQLLAFSRKQLLQPKVLDLNAVIGDMHKMLCRLIGEDIHLVTEPARDLARVKADPGQIEQIIVNLVINSRDAMPNGGTLTIATANVHQQNRNLRSTGPLVADYVTFSVTDTGCGMDPDTLSNVFEPFFTTKELGKGTGLGLATVYGIVKQSGGQVQVESSPGQGACFRIFLPRVDEGPADSKTPTIRPPLPQGSETILLVEDEDMVRKLACETLRMNGYIVMEARNGGEALLMCEQLSGHIDLMLTDVVMPQMNGRQLAERLGPLHPEMKVIYMSGYTDDILLHTGLGSKVEFIQKPFGPDGLAHKVREVLDSGNARSN